MIRLIFGVLWGLSPFFFCQPTTCIQEHIPSIFSETRHISVAKMKTNSIQSKRKLKYKHTGCIVPLAMFYTSCALSLFVHKVPFKQEELGKLFETQIKKFQLIRVHFMIKRVSANSPIGCITDPRTMS